MDSLVLYPTETAQWQALIHEAECERHVHLGENLESYLVFLLMRFIDKPEMAHSVLAMDFLDSMEAVGRERCDKLQELGDKCLLFAGLFPGCAEKRRVRISYFVHMGRNAYGVIAEGTRQANAKLFSEVAKGFVPMMDVLQTTRDITKEEPNLTPLQAQELWNDTGSAHARESLRLVTDAIPVIVSDDLDDRTVQ